MEVIKITEESSTVEEKVIFIIKEYLNKNRCFKVKDIVPFINVRLKKFSIDLNYNGIREILNSLIKRKLVYEGSKLIKDSVLDNENRKEIFESIKSHPGIYFNRIAKQLNLSNYILAWHLKILLKFEYIRSKFIENHEIFFEMNLESDNDEILYFISKEKSEEVINYLLLNQEGATRTKMSQDLKFHSSTVTLYVKKLEKYGILLKKELSNKTIYFVNERYYYEILNL